LNHFFPKLLLVACLLAGAESGAQVRKDSSVSAREAFYAVNLPPANAQRTADGRPGPGYWQNRADYEIRVSFDTASRRVSGKVNITYRNNSPLTLDYIWLTVMQNRFKRDSRASVTTPVKGVRFGVQEFTEGCNIHAITLAGGKPAAFETTDTYVKVLLPEPLAPGRQVQLSVAYDFVLPLDGSDYMGVLSAASGKVYQFGGMFPRVCVYDDLQGWNVFNAGYYVEPGRLDMYCTLPANMIMQGTGQLMNPREVLSPAILQRYEAAWKSDTAVHVLTGADQLTPTGTRTWHFGADNAGDGLWAVSSAFLWDAVKVTLPGTRSALAMALYPVESHKDWRGIAAEMKRILESYSGFLEPYPYPTCVNIGGGITGVGGPGVSVINYQQSFGSNSVWTKTNHELGHNWFNMMVAADSRHGWMCEGLNTYINLVNSEKLNGQPNFEYGAGLKYMSEYPPLPPLQTPAAAVSVNEMAMHMYMKPAMALTLLRNVVIGKERFDKAFNEFVHHWKFRHPSPNDFLRALQSATGEDLSWWWNSWFLHDWRADVAVTDVAYVKNNPANGVYITLENRGQMPAPVIVEVREFNGKVSRQTLPVQLWQQQKTHVFHYPSTSPVTAVILDPEGVVPDSQRANNTWTGSGAKGLAPAGLTAAQVIDAYLAAIGGKEQVKQLRHAAMRYTTADTAALTFARQWTPDSSHLSLQMEALHTELSSLRASPERIQLSVYGANRFFPAGDAKALWLSAALIPELHFFDAGFKTVLLPETLHINGMETYVIQVETPQGERWQYYYDVAGGLKVMEKPGHGISPQQLFYSHLEFAGYQFCEGIKLPTVLQFGIPGDGQVQLQLRQISLQKKYL